MSIHQEQQVLLGARIPLDLKGVLSRYCTSHGVKMNYFVAQALEEKLIEVAEDNRDLVAAKERLKNPEYISQIEFTKYLRKRGIKS